MMHIMKYNYVKKYPSVVAILLHVLVFSAFVFYVESTAEKIYIGESATPVLPSYVYEGHVSEEKISAEKRLDSFVQPEKVIQKKSSDRGVLKKVSTQTFIARAAKPVAKDAQLSTPQSEASGGQKKSELISLLHTAIQKQQHYPASAMQLEREGKATVMFTLYANGSISHLQVAQSSGTASLDEAAMAAVHDAVPFTEVRQYLHEPQVYRIDVVFELT
jgi:TonB family protein